jgi:cytolysin-activating lysine-acyltransferase
MMEQETARGADPVAAQAPTVSHVLGEMTWLLTQSPLHREFSIGDLEWLIMPPMIHRQFYIFRDSDKPVGLALWARCGKAAEQKLEKGMLEPEDRLTPEEWRSGEALWLVDLVAPFADADNRQREIMIADLISGPLAGQEIKFHLTNPSTGSREVQTIAADAGAKLREALEAKFAKDE